MKEHVKPSLGGEGASPFATISEKVGRHDPDRPTDEGQSRFHPGITQEVASNQSQRAPNIFTSEALISEALFVALPLCCRFEKGS
jgi:hypothetical protein